MSKTLLTKKVILDYFFFLKLYEVPDVSFAVYQVNRYDPMNKNIGFRNEDINHFRIFFI